MQGYAPQSKLVAGWRRTRESREYALSLTTFSCETTSTYLEQVLKWRDQHHSRSRFRCNTSGGPPCKDPDTHTLWQDNCKDRSQWNSVFFLFHRFPCSAAAQPRISAQQFTKSRLRASTSILDIHISQWFGTVGVLEHISSLWSSGSCTAASQRPGEPNKISSDRGG